jgi:uncharacterized protein (TIGR02271 family)
MTEDEKTSNEPEDVERPLEVGEEQHEATFTLSEEELIATTHDAEQGRVVIRKRVETVAHEMPVDVRRDDVEIERVAMDVDIDESPGVRQEGETTIVPVVVEVLVVEKRLKLVEEIRITKRRVIEQETVREDLRREVVEVDEEPKHT